MEQVVSRPTLSISDIIGDYSLLSAVRIILANTRIPIVCTYVRLQSHLVPLEDGRSSNMRSIPISQSSTYNSLAYVRKWMSRTLDVYTIHILKMPIYIARHTFFLFLYQSHRSLLSLKVYLNLYCLLLTANLIFFQLKRSVARMDEIHSKIASVQS